MLHPARPLRATYRLQINRTFTLADARGIVPYLQRLGVSHAYTSPLLAARPGSMHGYDVVDPARVNPEIGGEAAFRGFIHELHAHGMGLVLDIVPNHMGTGSANPYWDDVLAHGRHSRYARWFDIDWMAGSTDGRGRVVVPVLADPLEVSIAKGDLSVKHDADRGALRLRYGEESFPLDARTLEVLSDEVAGDTGESQSLLREVIDRQHYRLTAWRRAPDEINYRRFFDVTDLVALRMEDPAVFAATHARVLDWVADGSVDGLRVDHVDGLLDPQGYLDRLRAEVTGRRGEGFPIVVEKILARGERLRRSWPVQGTTGYDALADIEDLFIEARGFAAIERSYRRMLRPGGRMPEFEQIAIDGKRRVLRGSLRGDVARLVDVLEPIAANHEALVIHGPGVDGAVLHADRDVLADAVIEAIACLPVYRTYRDPAGAAMTDDDVECVRIAFARAREREVARDDALDLLEDVLRSPVTTTDPVERDARRHFIARFQQTSGPAAAKGVEDTALYTYMPLVSRNEVGSAPDRPLDDAVARFHRANGERATHWPLGFVCTNTHDAKRSADVRARLDVLSEMPEAWWERVHRWRTLNHPHRVMLGRRSAPDPNTEYLLYQVLVGIWPLGLDADELPDEGTIDRLTERVDSYMKKAGKEGKSRTSWVEPVTEFESATSRFVRAALRSPPFLSDFAQFASRVVLPALWGSLARIAVHLTVPGTPDTYQGDELWCFALVDPDNRRPVDYARRARMLESLAGEPMSAGSIETRDDGRIKMHLVHALLRARRDRPTLFAGGDYLPIAATGTHSSHVIAFARLHADGAALVVVPRFAASLVGGRGAPLGPEVWTDTTVPLPDTLAGRRWRSVLTGRQLGPTRSLAVGDLLAEWPVAVLIG